MNRSLLTSIALVPALYVAACSSTTTPGITVKSDAGGGDGSVKVDSGGGGGGNDSGVDATSTEDAGEDAMIEEDAETPVNGCAAADYTDFTAPGAMPIVTWQMPVTPNCLKISAGDSVTFNGEFSMHPLAALNGDSPSPFDTSVTSGMTTTKTFATAGTFGFVCNVHSSMTGAIKVVP